MFGLRAYGKAGGAVDGRGGLAVEFAVFLQVGVLGAYRVPFVFGSRRVAGSGEQGAHAFDVGALCPDPPVVEGVV
ncbi:hypothetical protein ACFC4S_35240, partial [Priestia megaterium]|uniref:hypothetical protein n=1 Tax=Priestia megaterium TaxID=1404 RepID=UPI0035DB5D0B